jgi:hypothetical protein
MHIGGPISGRCEVSMNASRALRGLTVLAVVAALTACSAPEHTFVASPEADLVLKLPRSWSTVRNETSASGVTGRPDGGWTAVFDAAHDPDAKHVDLNTSVKAPVAFAKVTVLDSDGATAMNGDKLRDIMLPFTAAARTQFAGDARVKTFQKISDYDVRSPVASGVHVVYSYDLGHGREVFDQIAMVGSRKSRVYMLVVRSDEASYESRKAQIAEIMKSFTVKVP